MSKKNLSAKYLDKQSNRQYEDSFSDEYPDFEVFSPQVGVDGLLDDGKYRPMTSSNAAQELIMGDYNPVLQFASDSADAFSSTEISYEASNLDQPQLNGNSVGSVSVGASSDQRINGLLSGLRWNGTITYSNPDAASDYQAGYNSDSDGDGISAQNEGFSQLSAEEMLAAHFALDASIYTQSSAAGGFSVEGFTNLDINYAGPGSGVSTIRIANSSDPRTSYAYYPSSGVTGGDVWIGPSARSVTAGNYGWYTMIHELGHALGLKHGQESGGPGNTALPSATDSMEYSIMTYRSYVGQSNLGTLTNESWGMAQTFMMYDIAALQYMYGADFNSNSGNTGYTWSPTTGQSFINGVAAISPGANRIFETIWDGNGVDTYNLSNYTSNLSIDLTPGGYSTFSSTQRAYLGGGPNGGYARGNVFNALQFNGDARSLIENAVGGTGNDVIIGNISTNTLTGGAGNDSLDGGAGTDYAAFSGSNTSYTINQVAANSFRVVGPDGSDTLDNIEYVIFSNGTYDLSTYDDIIGNVSTNKLLSVGENSGGNIELFGDHDWFRTQLVAGHNYIINLKAGPSGAGTLVDPYLRLYNSAGTLLSSNDDDGVGFDSQLAVRVSTSGTFYIDAAALGANQTGTYQVNLFDTGTTGRFESLYSGIAAYTQNNGGWGRQDRHPRYVADVNGDGLKDIVGFGEYGVYTSLATGGGNFATATGTGSMFTPGGGGWTSNNIYNREVADVSGDGKADIVGFGNAGTFVSLGNGDGTFATAKLALAAFGVAAGGWDSEDHYPRQLTDVNGDGRADIVGFGEYGVYTSLATSGGDFAAATFSPLGFTPSAGGWSSDNTFHRELADVTGDGKADIVGFGLAGTYVSLGNGDGTFSTAKLALTEFGVDANAGGWSTQDRYPRHLADVNGDSRADIVGFGEYGVLVSLATGDGNFAAPTFELSGYSPSVGSWNSDDQYRRILADVTGDGRSDIVGFGNSNVLVASSHDFMTI
ncbi:FG-GAP-like repeat-containing protein [Methylobacterium sp. Gmos1]